MTLSHGVMTKDADDRMEACAYAEHLINYAYNEMCTVIEGAVEITADGGEMVIYRAGDTFFMAKGFTGIWESHTRFRKYFMIRLG